MSTHFAIDWIKKLSCLLGDDYDFIYFHLKRYSHNGMNSKITQKKLTGIGILKKTIASHSDRVVVKITSFKTVGTETRFLLVFDVNLPKISYNHVLCVGGPNSNSMTRSVCDWSCPFEEFCNTYCIWSTCTCRGEEQHYYWLDAVDRTRTK